MERPEWTEDVEEWRNDFRRQFRRFLGKFEEEELSKKQLDLLFLRDQVKNAEPDDLNSSLQRFYNAYESEREKLKSVKKYLSHLPDKPDEQKIERKRSELLDSLKNISRFDRSQLKGFGDEIDLQKVRNVAHDFGFHLYYKGWDEEDIQNLCKKLHGDNVEIEKVIESAIRKNKEEYRYLIFLPHIEFGARVSGTDLEFFPAGARTLDDLTSTTSLKKSENLDSSLIIDLLAEQSSVEFSVSAYGEKQSRKEAFDKLSEILDSFALFKPGRYLEDPQYFDQLRYTRWMPGKESYVGPGMKQEPKFFAEMEKEQLEYTSDELEDIRNTESTIADKFQNSLHFLRKAENSERDIDSCIFTIAALEALLSEPDEDVETKDIKEKFSKFQWQFPGKAEIRLEKHYDARHKALHEGRIVDEINASSGRQLVRNILSETAHAIQEKNVENLEELLRFFEQPYCKNCEKKVVEDSGLCKECGTDIGE